MYTDTTHGNRESSLLHQPDKAVNEIYSFQQHIYGNVINIISLLVSMFGNAGSKKKGRYTNRCKALLI